MNRPIVNYRMLKKLPLRCSLILTGLAIASCIALGACNHSSASKNADRESDEDDFHADNDIAMTVRSIADAISVGEPLDTTEYNFEGVLTDGQGTPLYTDIQGTPGEWQVVVTSPSIAVIRNIYLGDLLTNDLRVYITSMLNLSDSDIVASDDFDDDDESELVVYRFHGGFLRFESRAGIAPNGLEGPLLSIVITGDSQEV